MVEVKHQKLAQEELTEQSEVDDCSSETGTSSRVNESIEIHDDTNPDL